MDDFRMPDSESEDNKNVDLWLIVKIDSSALNNILLSETVSKLLP